MMDAHGMDASPVLDVGALDRGGEPKNLSVAPAANAATPVDDVKEPSDAKA